MEGKIRRREKRTQIKRKNGIANKFIYRYIYVYVYVQSMYKDREKNIILTEGEAQIECVCEFMLSISFARFHKDLMRNIE